MENFAVNCWRRARSLKHEFEFTEHRYVFENCARGLATLVRYQTVVGRELAQADDAIKQMAERSRISDEGEDNPASMPLSEEKAEIPNSEGIETPLDSGATDGADISAVPNLTERTQ